MAFGIDDLAIAAMLASAAVQSYSANRSAQKQQQAIREAQGRQLQARNQATDAAMRRVEDFNPTTRTQRQAELTDQLTAGYDKQVAGPQITAQGVQVGATIPEGTGGDDYLKTKAREQAKTTASLHALAGLLGRTGGASELRRGEAVGIGDTAGEIGRIGTGANNVWQSDQAGINAAGVPSLGATIASAALNAYGTSRLMPGAAKAAGPTTGDFARMDRAGAWLTPG